MPDTTAQTDQSNDEDRPLTPDERLALAAVYGLLTVTGAQR